MVKVAWKVINGYGPYAYLQKSVKKGKKVTSQHVAYLGSAGLSKTGLALVPGKHLDAPAIEEFPGGRIFIPPVGEETESKLKPNPKAAIQFMEQQAEAGIPTKEIIAGLQAMKSKKGKKSQAKKVAPNTPAAQTHKVTDGEKEAAVSAGADMQARGSPVVGSTWTKLESAKGSTQGGLYENEKGEKYYIKIPATASHVHNEQFARDLYALAGVRVLEGTEIEIDGKAALATPWEEGLTGSGTNPKNLTGTLEGFVADAWLANWDSVGVGSTKYDNILNLDGEAVRVDTGGALLYRGTGGPKGSKFGLEVTELDGLRDPKLNVVAATVYGDMSLEQIRDSAESVMAIESDDILDRVRDRFKDDPQLAADLGAKLLIRRNSIRDWLKKKAKEEGKDLQIPEPKKSDPKKKVAPNKPSASATEEVTPALGDASSPLKVTEITQGPDGNPLISDADIAKLEEAALLGSEELTKVAKQLHGEKKAQLAMYEAGAINVAANDLHEQIKGPSTQGHPGDSTDDQEPPVIRLIPEDKEGKLLISHFETLQLEKAALKSPAELDSMAEYISNLTVMGPKKKAIQAAVDHLKAQMPEAHASDPQDEQVEQKQAAQGLVDVLSAAKEKVAPNTQTGQAPSKPAVPATSKPKLEDVPLNNKGKPLISKLNVKKLEAAAAKGPDELDEVAKTITDKLLHPPKKAAVINAASELKGQIQGVDVQEGDGGSGLAQTMEKVEKGDVKLPKQEPPSKQVSDQQEKKLKSSTKNYDADLEQVSGAKGSNEGGLFKDKHLDTLHYVKWPNSSTRAKVEALTGLLYEYAKVPVPSLRVVKFQGKDAVMSDWIEDSSPMTFTEMSKHKDVRWGFIADAWLANWDVVGASADNVVQGPGNKAYRIDVGGSLIFRAQGKPKAFPNEVQELESMRNSSTAPQASKVFAKLTQAQLREGAKKVAAVTDAQVDAAVDSVNLPKKSADYPASTFGKEANDLPKMLKARLKARRDWLVEEVLAADKKQAAVLAYLQEKTDLTEKSTNEVVTKGAKFKATSPTPNTKWGLAERVMRNELGNDKGKAAAAQTRSRYDSWKGSSISSGGAVLRWAAGAMHGEGRKELSRMKKYNDFLVAEGEMTEQKAKEHAEFLEQATGGGTAAHLVDGLRMTNRQNELIHTLQNPAKEKVTIYRGWKPNQVKYIGAQGANVGDTVVLADPPIYSWSFSPATAGNFGGGHGSFVTRADVPIDSIVLTDIANSTGTYGGENEVLFKGVPNLEMEVTKTY